VEALVGDVGDMIKAGGESMSEMIVTSTNSLGTTLANIVRKIISTSATSLSIGVAGVLGFAIYRSYMAEKASHHQSLRAQLLNSFQEPDIGQAQRTKEEVDEVRTLFLFFLFARFH
jgi:hypothetical protein